MDAISERRRFLQAATDKPSSLASSVLLDSANFVDAIFARVERVAPESYAKAHTLIATAAIHNVLQRSTPTMPVAPTIAFHIPSVSHLAAAIQDEDTHVALAGAVALAAVSKAIDVSGTRYGVEISLALGMLEARSLVEPFMGSAVNYITNLACASEHCYKRVSAKLLASLRLR